MKTFKLSTGYFDFRINLYDMKIVNGCKHHKIKLFVNNEYYYSTIYGVEHFILIFNIIIKYYERFYKEEGIKKIINWVEESLNYLEIKRRTKIEKLMKNIKNQ
jgi:hypothetical protein